MASKKSGKRAAAAWDSPLVKRRNDLIQREARFLADEGEDLPRGARSHVLDHLNFCQLAEAFPGFQEHLLGDR
jgi:hypothetical protein